MFIKSAIGSHSECGCEFDSETKAGGGRACREAMLMKAEWLGKECADLGRRTRT